MAFGIDDAIAAGLKILDKFIPDPEQRAKAAEQYQLSMERLRVEQMRTNQEEIKSGHILGKWRGFLGWAIACSFVYQFIIMPFLVFLILTFQPTFPVEKLPKLEWQELGKLLLGMLGIA
jgi:hypothetical protein